MGLAAVEIVMEVEERFAIKIADPEAEQMRTVAGLAALVVSKLPVQFGLSGSAPRVLRVISAHRARWNPFKQFPPCPISEQEILEEVRKITASVIGLPLERIRPESDFVKDLEID